MALAQRPRVLASVTRVPFPCRVASKSLEPFSRKGGRNLTPRNFRNIRSLFGNYFLRNRYSYGRYLKRVL